MHTAPPDERRTKLVRIADVPLEVRRRAAAQACREVEDVWEKLRIRILAEDPGDLVAWVAP